MTKKMNTTRLLSKIGVFALFCLQISCSKDEADNVTFAERSNRGAKLPSYGCGSVINDSWTTLNEWHNYGAYVLDFTGVAPGTRISIACVTMDAPNRFYLKDGNNFGTITYIPNDNGTSSSPSVDGWLGYANYSGQWSRPNNPSNPVAPNISKNSTQTYEFTKQAGVDVYNLWVEGQTGPNLTDAWQVSITCDSAPSCNCCHQ